MTLHRSDIRAFHSIQRMAWDNEASDLQALITIGATSFTSSREELFRSLRLEEAGQDEDDPRDPLSLATWRGHVDTMTVLLDAGVRPHPGMHRVGSLEAAALLQERGQWPTVLWNGERWPLEDEQRTLNQALNAAAGDLQPEMVRHWLERGASPRALNAQRLSPVHAMLMRAWAPSDYRDPSWPSTDDISLPWRALDTVEALLDGGMPVDLRNGFGATPLLTALCHPNSLVEQTIRLTVAHRLVTAGADVNAIGGEGSVLWSAMDAIGPASDPELWDLAAIRRSPVPPPGAEDLIRVLLARGARIVLPVMTIEPSLQEGVRDLRKTVHTRITDPLRLGALPDGSETVLLRAVRSRSMAALEHALALGADLTAMGGLRRGINPTAFLARSPMMLAVEFGWDAGIDRLVRAFQDTGTALDEELANAMWGNETLAALPGKVLVERRLLEHAVHTDEGALTRVARERGRARL